MGEVAVTGSEDSVGARLLRQLRELADSTYRYTGDRLIGITVGPAAFACLKSELAPNAEFAESELLAVGAAFGQVLVHRQGVSSSISGSLFKVSP